MLEKSINFFIRGEVGMEKVYQSRSNLPQFPEEVAEIVF